MDQTAIWVLASYVSAMAFCVGNAVVTVSVQAASEEQRLGAALPAHAFDRFAWCLVGQLALEPCQTRLIWCSTKPIVPSHAIPLWLDSEYLLYSISRGSEKGDFR